MGQIIEMCSKCSRDSARYWLPLTVLFDSQTGQRRTTCCNAEPIATVIAASMTEINAPSHGRSHLPMDPPEAL